MDGILSVNKEAGYTSNDVIAVLRGILRMKKIGHTGTLDPGATGVLPVCLGKATKAAELLTAAEKEYEAELVFGFETDTQDLSGKVTRSGAYVFSESRFQEAVRELTGEIWQTPPMYSALKIGGVRLYDLAREGKEVERQPRRIRIEEIQVKSLNEKGARIRVRCSKGTYIRTLVEDLGRKTGYLACMTSLCRLRSGPFVLEESLRLEEIQRLRQEGRLEEKILPIDRMFEQLPSYRIRQEQEKRLQNGNSLVVELPGLPCGEKVRIYDSAGQFAALYEAGTLENGTVCCKAYKMFR